MKLIKTILIFTLLILISGFKPLPRRCTCDFSGPFIDVAVKSHLVVTATILRKKQGVIKAEVHKVLKGTYNKKRIIIKGDQSGISCFEDLSNYQVEETYAFAVKKSNLKGYLLSRCGEFTLKIENGEVKGMIDKQHMIKHRGDDWPQWNNKTMNEEEFYTLFHRYDTAMPPPCLYVKHYAPSKALEKDYKTVKENPTANNLLDPRAYYRAVNTYNLPLIDYYLQRGEILESVNFDELVLIAADKGYIDMIKLFIERGISPDLHNSQGSYIVHRSVEYPELLAYLYKAGADMDARDNDGNTPLILAVRNGCTESIKFLIDHGADVTATNKQGWTVKRNVKIFNQLNRKEVLKILKEK
jgi:hypothetical protein